MAWRRKGKPEPAESPWRKDVEQLIQQLDAVVARLNEAADRFERGVRDA